MHALLKESTTSLNSRTWMNFVATKEWTLLVPFVFNEQVAQIVEDQNYGIGC